MNTRPSLAFAAPSITVHEGDTAALALAATDAEGDALAYNWSFGDGTSLNVPATTASPAVRRPWADQGRYTVRVIAADPSGTRDTATLAVTVLSRAPAARFVAPPYGFEGKTYALSVSGVRDGAADLRAGIQASFDCGAGYGAWAVVTRVACPAVADDDTLEVGVRLRDKDGAVAEHRRAFVVHDAQPVVAASAVTATTIAPRVLFIARGQFSDAGRQDAPWRVRYFWGDGLVSTLTVTEQGWIPPMARAYGRPGTYSVVVYVTDKDGRNGKSAPITVTVR